MAALLWQSCLETSWQHFRNYAFTCWSCPVANIFSQDKATNSWPLSSEWAWSIQRYSKLDDWNVEHVLVMTKMTRMSGLLEALAMRFANQGGWRPCNKISNEAFVWIFYIVMQLSFMSTGFVVYFFLSRFSAIFETLKVVQVIRYINETRATFLEYLVWW